MSNFYSKYKTFLFRLLCWCSAAILTCSCVSELTDNQVYDRDAYTISLNLKIVNSSSVRKVQTRAIGEEPGDKYRQLNENLLQDIHIYFFNKDQNNTLFSHPTDLQYSDFPSGEKEIKIRLSQEEALNKYNGKELIVVAIANAEVPQINTLSELEDILLHKELNKKDVKQASFVMDGKINSTGTIEWKGKKLYSVPSTIELRRAAAKVRFLLGKIDVTSSQNGKDEKYVMEGEPQVKFVNYNEKTSLTQWYASSDNVYKESEYWSMNTTAGALFASSDDGFIVPENVYTTDYPFYSYENDWTSKSENETFLLLKLMLRPVKSLRKAKPYYYRIPINYRGKLPSMSNEEKEGLHKLQRNYLYTIISDITVLGSEAEEKPVEIRSNIAEEPWIEEVINSSLQNIHYLMIKEHYPEMLNVSERNVMYQSDLPVKIDIDSVYYVHYNETGQKFYMMYFQYDNTKIEDNKTFFKIYHPLRVKKYVPMHIAFTVTQILPDGETGTPLSDHVHAIQYPPKFVTAEKSPGLSVNGTSYNDKEYKNPVYADFRFHDTFGTTAYYGNSNKQGPQINGNFYRITTLVNTGHEIIGDPTGGNTDGKTINDDAHNNMISPEFIIASQHGMSVLVKQFASPGDKSYSTYNDTPGFAPNYGPFSSRFNKNEPYASEGNNFLFINYNSAEDRCAQYFEGDYGTDGLYWECYGRGNFRKIYKKFKYKGRWRIPTFAELKYIDGLQDEPESAVKSLLWGSYYWSAKPLMAYNLNTNTEQEFSISIQENSYAKRRPYVRCVFDTYKVNDKIKSYE